MSVGSEPLSAFVFMDRNVSEVKVNSTVGMGPLKLLLLKSRCLQVHAVTPRSRQKSRQ